MRIEQINEIKAQQDFNKKNYTSSENYEEKAQQLKLASFYKRLLSGPMHFKNVPDNLDEYEEIRKIEDAWNAKEEEKIKHIPLPGKNTDFISWYNTVNTKHKFEVKPFFNFLAKRATLEELGFYICMEEKVDGSFDDTIALAQLGVTGRAKMVLAENYWDEMGNGHAHLVHTKMFTESADYMKKILKQKGIDLSGLLPVEALKNGNVLMMYGLRRRYIPRLLGVIGILEDTASERFQSTVLGMERFNLPDFVIKYHRAHIQIDSKHGKDLLEHVLIPTVNTGSVDYIHEICRGILIRFNIAIDYYKSIENIMEQFKTSVING